MERVVYHLKKSRRNKMKMSLAVTILCLYCLVGVVRASDDKLPIDTRISMEKIRIIEEYRTALQKCREHSRKSARDTCIERRKDRLDKTLEELQQNPKAYFIAKEASHG
jgi:hypothetical protein